MRTLSKILIVASVASPTQTVGGPFDLSQVTSSGSVKASTVLTVGASASLTQITSTGSIDVSTPSATITVGATISISQVVSTGGITSSTPTAAPIDWDYLLLFNETSGGRCNSATGLNNGFIAEDLVKADAGHYTGDYQGYTTDGDQHWTSGTTTLARHNSSWVEQARNNSIFSVDTGDADHLGDVKYYNGTIYGYLNNSPTIAGYLAEYDATTLALTNVTDVSAHSLNAGGVTIDADHGHIYFINYLTSNISYYDLVTKAYIGNFYPDIDILRGNGIDYHDGHLYISSVAGQTSGRTGQERIYQISVKTRKLTRVFRIPDAYEIEGVDFTQGEARWNDYPTATVFSSALPSITRTAGEYTAISPVIIPYTHTTEGSIALTIKPNDFSVTRSVFDREADASSTLENDWECWIAATTGVLNFRIDSTSTLVSHTLPSATATYNVIITWSGSGGSRTVKLYVDGVLEDTATQVWTTISESINIGAGNPGNGVSGVTYYDVASFPRELSAGEVAAYDVSSVTSTILVGDYAELDPVTSTGHINVGTGITVGASVTFGAVTSTGGVDSFSTQSVGSAATLGAITSTGGISVFTVYTAGAGFELSQILSTGQIIVGTDIIVGGSVQLAGLTSTGGIDVITILSVGGSVQLAPITTTGGVTSSGPTLGGIHNVIGTFTTGGSVSITLYSPVTGVPVSLSSSICPEIGATGIYIWDTSKLSTQPVGYQEYVWSMTDGSTSDNGVLVLSNDTSQIAELYKRFDLDSTDQNTYSNNGGVISNDSFTLTKSDNGNGTFDVVKT